MILYLCRVFSRSNSDGETLRRRMMERYRPKYSAGELLIGWTMELRYREGGAPMAPGHPERNAMRDNVELARVLRDVGKYVERAEAR
jgi:hypothetical protein